MKLLITAAAIIAIGSTAANAASPLFPQITHGEHIAAPVEATPPSNVPGHISHGTSAPADDGADNSDSIHNR